MKTNALMAVAICAAAAIAAPGRALANPEFIGYEGRNAIHEGQGGEKKTINGIDFWSNGDPPHRFKVLGAISDRRMKTGLYGMIRMSGLEFDIAKAASAAGGDAVILQNEGDDLLGVSGFGNAYASGNRSSVSAFGSSFSAPVQAHMSRYIVVKYLPDDPALAGAGAVGAVPAPVGTPPAGVSPVQAAPSP